MLQAAVGMIKAMVLGLNPSLARLQNLEKGTSAWLKSEHKNAGISGPDTPLPDLNIVVTDDDVGKNAEFELVRNSAFGAIGRFLRHSKGLSLLRTLAF